MEKEFIKQILFNFWSSSLGLHYVIKQFIILFQNCIMELEILTNMLLG